MAQHEKVLSLTRKDFVVQTFRAGGKGGQHQNKRNTGVRIIHPASGARGESREHRTQLANRKAAFERLVAMPRFRAWLAQAHQSALGRMSPEERVRRMMAPRFLKIEGRDAQGRWRLLDDNTKPEV